MAAALIQSQDVYIVDITDPRRKKKLKTTVSTPQDRSNFRSLTSSKVMQVERKWHILLTIFFLLITSGQCMDSKEVKSKERRTLLDLILQVIRDSQQREKPVSKRCNSGLLTSAQDMKPLYVPRLDNSRLIEMVPRDVNMKGKIIQHFTGPVKFSLECRTHFHRLYHNTRDCSTPAYYKRCARLLTRLAMSPVCMQS